MIATPQTGIDSIMVSAGLLGWPFALFKVLAALVTGVLGGWWIDALPDEAEQLSDEGAHDHGHGPWSGVLHAVDLVRMVWRWLVFGVLLSAALTTLLPPDALGAVSAGSVLAGFAVALVVSLPMYVCATASVPIAAALVAAGLPSGAALVFLMAGPATNLATLGAVRGAYGWKVTAAYVTTLVVGSMAFGLAYEPLFGPLQASAMHIHESASLWALGSTVVLCAMLLWFAWEDVSGWLGQADASQAEAFSVEGMSCNGCANRLQRELLAHGDVEAVTVSFEDASALIQSRMKREQLAHLIEDSGFKVAS